MAHATRSQMLAVWLLAAVAPACGDSAIETGSIALAGDAVAQTDPCDVATCDDGNPCTIDSCGVADCVHLPTLGTATCDDGDPCTVDDSCLDGACQGAGDCPASIATQLGKPADQGFADVAQLADGDFVLAGWSGPAGWVLRTAANGTPKAERVEPEWTRNLVATLPGGSAVFAGNGTSSPVPGGKLASIERIDPLLQPAWSVLELAPVTDLAALPAGVGVVTALHGCVRWLGLDGALSGQWCEVGKVTRVRGLADGGAIVGTDPGGLARWSADGHLAWKRGLVGPPWRLDAREDGTLAVTARKHWGEKPYLTLIDAGGSVRMDAPAGHWSLYVSDLLTLSDGGALMLAEGQEGFSSEAPVSFLSRRDRWGEPVWWRQLPPKVDANALAVRTGGYVAAGALRKPKVGWLGLLDAWGHDASAASKCPADEAGCDDGNPCTADDCELAKGCVHRPRADGAPCASGKVCRKATMTMHLGDLATVLRIEAWSGGVGVLGRTLDGGHQLQRLAWTADGGVEVAWVREIPDFLFGSLAVLADGTAVVGGTVKEAAWPHDKRCRLWRWLADGTAVLDQLVGPADWRTCRALVAVPDGVVLVGGHDGKESYWPDTSPQQGKGAWLHLDAAGQTLAVVAEPDPAPGAFSHVVRLTSGTLVATDGDSLHARHADLSPAWQETKLPGYPIDLAATEDGSLLLASLGFQSCLVLRKVPGQQWLGGYAELTACRAWLPDGQGGGLLVGSDAPHPHACSRPAATRGLPVPGGGWWQTFRAPACQEGAQLVAGVRAPDGGWLVVEAGQGGPVRWHHLPDTDESPICVAATGG